MAFINKNNIHVFPVTNKPSEKQSRLTTEYNITNIVNRLLDTKSFVITSEVTSGESALEFNIQGYYVKVDKISDLGTPTTASDCYATITIISKTLTDDNTQTFIELDGGEETKTNEDGTTEKNEDGTDVIIYTGVAFSWEAPNTEPTTEDGEYTLHILHYNGSKYTIPRASKIRFNQFAINKIDDGDLDDNSTIYN